MLKPVGGIRCQVIPADKITCGGHNQAFNHIKANTTLGQNYFQHEAISDWNSFPASAIEATMVNDLKSFLRD